MNRRMTRPPIDQQITFLYAEEPEASWKFYEEVMELPLVQDQGMVRIYGVDGARALLGVCRARGPRLSGDPRIAGGVIFTFVTREVEAWHAFLTGKGLALAAPAFSAAHGITHFFLEDPAGYRLEVQRFERPD